MRVEEEVRSRDGTLKWRLRVRGAPVETVLIPTPTRATVCVSSQSGCTRWCDFCATARMPFSGSLGAGEMVAQVLLARRHAEVPLTNVVFMGMGEPLDNLGEVLGAIRVLDQGLGIAPRHATVSTSGVLPRMRQLWAESRASIALSLHATTQELRDRLMPRVRRWPLKALTAFMREASAAREDGRKPRHFFIEYALMAGVNDAEADAERLVALLEGVRARVNLIPFNPAPALPFQRPSRERIRAFQERVMAGGLLTIVRESRGEDAGAACGQLAASALGAAS
jgi:23S rRNA (adenine2503-C2)-methyltransferase